MSNSDLISPFQFIKLIDPPDATYARGEFDENMVKYTMLLVRETLKAVERLGEHPIIELRAGLLLEQQVLLAIVMLRINGTYYETWWNYHQPAGRVEFDDMSKQELLPILFFTPELARSIAIRNSLAPFFQAAVEELAKTTAWSMSEFDEARQRIFDRFPTETKMWNHLQRIK